jgi:MtN3 and saliva related transmembrane protein
MSQLANIIGTGAALCSMTSFGPQIVKIWRERDASSVSLRMYLVTVTGFVLWSVYGVLIGSWPVIASNVVCLAMSGAVLGLKWRFSRRSWRH